MGKKKRNLIKDEIVRSFMSWGVSYDYALYYADKYKGRKLQIKMAQTAYNYRNKIERDEFYERALSVNWKLKKKDISSKTKRNALLSELEKREEEQGNKYKCLYIIVTYKGLIEKDYGIERYLENVLMKKSNSEIENYILDVVKNQKSFGKIGTISMMTSLDFGNASMANAISECGRSGNFVIYAGLPKTVRQFLLTLLKIVVLIYQAVEKESAYLSFCDLVLEYIEIKTVSKKAREMGEKI